MLQETRKLITFIPSCNLGVQSQELAQIFAAAPSSPFVSALAPETARAAYLKSLSGAADESGDEIEVVTNDKGKKKVEEGDECPICYEDIREGGKGQESLVYDTAGCGKGVCSIRLCLVSMSWTTRSR